MVSKVAVLGATGSQGGAVAAALLAKGIYVVAVTRNADSPKAKAFADKTNSEVRVANLDDIDSLIAAFNGCDGAYIIANFFETNLASAEMLQYKNCATALKACHTMKHIVYSTLEESTLPELSYLRTLEENETGPMKVPHMDSKNRAEVYFKDLPTTFVLTSCYAENFTNFFSLVKGEDGTYSFTLPLGKTLIPWTILPDLGTFVAGIYDKPDLIGKTVGQASFYATGDELAVILSKATGKTIKYNCVPWDTFASFGFPGAEELAQMFEFMVVRGSKMCDARSMEMQKSILNGATYNDPVQYMGTLPLKYE